jgi:hypothetical protein
MIRSTTHTRAECVVVASGCILAVSRTVRTGNILGHRRPRSVDIIIGIERAACWNRNRSRSNLRPAIYYGESDIHQANVWVRDYDGNTGVTCALHSGRRSTLTVTSAHVLRDIQ